MGQRGWGHSHYVAEHARRGLCGGISGVWRGFVRRQPHHAYPARAPSRRHFTREHGDTAGSANMSERMLQSLFLHTEHVAPSRAASHSSLGTLSAGGRALGQRAQSLPVRHAERLLALGLEARARSGRATPRGLQGGGSTSPDRSVPPRWH